MNGIFAFKSGTVDTLYPEINESIAAIMTVWCGANPATVPTVTPMSSPIAQPARQWSVALAAILLTECPTC